MRTDTHLNPLNFHDYTQILDPDIKKFGLRLLDPRTADFNFSNYFWHLTLLKKTHEKFVK
jgi:hypothetical protein